MNTKIEELIINIKKLEQYIIENSLVSENKLKFIQNTLLDCDNVNENIKMILEDNIEKKNMDIALNQMNNYYKLFK